MDKFQEKNNVSIMYLQMLTSVRMSVRMCQSAFFKAGTATQIFIKSDMAVTSFEVPQIRKF